MPSGRTHNLINLGVLAVFGTGALAAQRQGLLDLSTQDAVVFTAAYLAGTFLLSPDLDLAEGHVDSKRAWGALGFLWVPYGLLFSHRGWSHSWLVGPLTRLAYLSVMLGVILGFVRLAWPDFSLPPGVVDVTWQAALPLLGGYYLSQWLHLIADGIRPDHKLRRKRR